MNAELETSLQFLGAAGTVTGSRFLVRARGAPLLLDCGLFQGLKALRLRNRAPFDFDPRALQAVLLSHAHLDHSGALPLLAQGGFTGSIHCTPGTAELLELLLLDSAHIQEEDAERANRRGYSKHQPALPLYRTEDVRRVLQQVRTHPYGEPFDVAPHARVTLRRAGHILGSATVELLLGGHLRLVHTGDLGRWGRPILRDPEQVPEADVLLVEGTYGNRVHAPDAEEQLVRVITEAAARGGAVVVPVFAVGRAQELLWTLRRLQHAQRLPLVSVYLDSPMAQDVTEVYCRHPEDHDADMQQLKAEQQCPLCRGRYHLVRTAAESKALNDRSGPMVILAGSGMATGGRVLHHLRYRLPDHRTTVLLAGYQAAGTRGRALQEGARTVRIHGQDVPVRAHVETVDGLSAHADREELLRWLGGFRRPPRQTWVVHAEPEAAAALAATVHERLGWRVGVAEDGRTVPLDR